MVEDLLDEIDTLNGIATYLFYTPTEAGGLVGEWLGSSRCLQPQGDGDLGARLVAAARFASDAGHTHTLLVASDTPDLPAAAIVEAFGRLTDADVVIGPAPDGGYYLIGMRQPCAEIFESIPWSTGRVLRETIRRAEAQGLEVHLLEPRADVDTCEDAIRFRDATRVRGDGKRGSRTLALLDVMDMPARSKGDRSETSDLQ